MIAHISIGVRDVERSKRFYDAVLEPLGYKCIRAARTLRSGGHDNGAPGLRPDTALIITLPSSSTRTDTGSRPITVRVKPALSWRR
jgi:catechol 2,3-dioxygenase-like lactoylglutathione lyase family enzyme